MRTTSREEVLERLSRVVAERLALNFPPERYADLERRALEAAQEFGFADAEAFLGWLVSAPLTREHVEMLASHLTIGETYFWREPRAFEALESHVLPALIRAAEHRGRRLRIWSAGCATGEEPYSIAIALQRALPSRGGWKITLLATDINARILLHAAAGVYGDWSVRDVPAWLREKYLQRGRDGRYTVVPSIRRMVSFAYLNLAEDNYPSVVSDTTAMDIVFCRNVLMYFSTERAARVARNFRRSLVDGGWLMVAACELSQELFQQFTPVRFQETTVYRRVDAPPSATPALAAASVEAWIPPLPVPGAARPPAAEALSVLPHFERSS